jgi:hypothetical protein
MYYCHYFLWMTEIAYFRIRSNCDHLNFIDLIMSEWMIVLKPQLKSFSTISWQEQVNFQWEDDDVRFVLDKHA